MKDCEHKMVCTPHGWDACTECGAYGECPRFYGGECEHPETEQSVEDVIRAARKK